MQTHTDIHFSLLLRGNERERIRSFAHFLTGDNSLLPIQAPDAFQERIVRYAGPDPIAILGVGSPLRLSSPGLSLSTPNRGAAQSRQQDCLPVPFQAILRVNRLNALPLSYDGMCPSFRAVTI